MKIKLFFVVAFLVAQSAFAARLSVYNKTQYVQDINIYAGSNWQRAHRIAPRGKKSIDAGLNAFSLIRWGKPENVNSNSPMYSVRYEALIPSSVTMLTGSFMLWNNGEYGINFDKNGASSSKVSAEKGTIIK